MKNVGIFNLIKSFQNKFLKHGKTKYLSWVYKYWISIRLSIRPLDLMFPGGVTLCNSGVTFCNLRVT